MKKLSAKKVIKRATKKRVNEELRKRVAAELDALLWRDDRKLLSMAQAAAHNVYAEFVNTPELEADIRKVVHSKVMVAVSAAMDHKIKLDIGGHLLGRYLAGAHTHTDSCGFDRSASHSEDRYVCTCGWRG